MNNQDKTPAFISHRRVRQLATAALLATGMATLSAQDTSGQNSNSQNSSSMGSTAGTATDTGGTTTPAKEADSLSHADKRFMMKAAQASTNEVALSALADSRASNADVKTFAQMMISDHGKANADLQALASSKGVDITKAVEKGNKEDVESLSAKSGADFDKAYAKNMLSAHEDAVKLFKKESDDGKDPDVVAFAKKYVDTLSMHLDHAKALKQTVDP